MLFNLNRKAVPAQRRGLVPKYTCEGVALRRPLDTCPRSFWIWWDLLEAFIINNVGFFKMLIIVI